MSSGAPSGAKPTVSHLKSRCDTLGVQIQPWGLQSNPHNLGLATLPLSLEDPVWGNLSWHNKQPATVPLPPTYRPPGLAQRMSASDRVVVVLGGAGTVGSGIVKALLEKGFQVAVISRDESRLEKLRQFLPPSACDRLHALVGDVGSEEGAEDAKGALLKAVGKVTDVVSSLGFSWWQGGPPLSQSLKELHRVLDTLLLSTFTAWKAFFPLVKDNPNGSYTFITGGAGERLLMPGTGFLTLGAAGALAFSLIVREEYPDVPCKLNEVKINMGVTTPERLGPGYVSHLEVGKAVASLVEKRAVSHTVLSAVSPADLKTLALEGKI